MSGSVGGERPNPDGDHGRTEGVTGEPLDIESGSTGVDQLPQATRHHSEGTQRSTGAGGDSRSTGRARPAAKRGARRVGSGQRDLGYARRANQYAQEVVSGKIPAGEYVRLACKRHLADLANDSVLWQYRFDIPSAERICAFAEFFTHVKGPLGGKQFILEPWECFIFCSIFGWVKKHTGGVSRGKLLRRFRKAYCEVPKGNGKSYIVSIIALYMLALDGERGAEIWSAATTREQAGIVFKVAQQMARNAPKICQKYGIEIAAHDIHLKNDPLSVFKTLASEADSAEGKNPHLCIFDELHAQSTRELFENLESAMSKRDNNLLLSITTAGYDQLSVCYEERKHVIEAITLNAEGTGMMFPDETLFGIIYTSTPTMTGRKKRRGSRRTHAGTPPSTKIFSSRTLAEPSSPRTSSHRSR